MCGPWFFHLQSRTSGLATTIACLAASNHTAPAALTRSPCFSYPRLLIPADILALPQTVSSLATGLSQRSLGAHVALAAAARLCLSMPPSMELQRKAHCFCGKFPNALRAVALHGPAPSATLRSMKGLRPPAKTPNSCQETVRVSVCVCVCAEYKSNLPKRCLAQLEKGRPRSRLSLSLSLSFSSVSLNLRSRP